MGEHKYDASTGKCSKCGAGIYTTGRECPERFPEEEQEEDRFKKIWKAIQDFAR